MTMSGREWLHGAGAAVVLAMLAGCVPQYVDRRPIPGVNAPAATPAYQPAAPPTGSGTAVGATSPVPSMPAQQSTTTAPAAPSTLWEVEARQFAGDVTRVRSSGEVGCLPLQGYDLNRDYGGPYVPLLGERISDTIADELPGAGFTGRVLSTSAMQLRLSQANISRFFLDDLSTLTDLSGRLGLDLVVHGSIRRDDGFGANAGSTLRVELSAWDVHRGQVVASRRFDLASTSPLAAVTWDLFRRESLWAPESRHGAADTAQSLDKEMEALSRQLADQFMNQVDADRISGIVYVAPADAGTFVKAVAELRAAQVAFGREYERRESRAQAAGEALDEASPLSLLNLQFENLQDAESFLIERRETLMATNGARLCRKMSSMIAQEMRPRLQPYEVRVNDIGFTKWSDTQLVEGELATGGLANSLKARNDMRAAGIALAVQPMIERWGDGFRLRLEAYDLGQAGIAASASVAVAPEFREEFGQELGDLMEAGDAASGH